MLLVSPQQGLFYQQQRMQSIRNSFRNLLGPKGPQSQQQQQQQQQLSNGGRPSQSSSGASGQPQVQPTTSGRTPTPSAREAVDIGNLNIVQDKDNKRFECMLSDGQLAYVSYDFTDEQVNGKNCVVILYAFCPPRYRGQGIVGKLTCRFLQYCKTNDYCVTVSPYAHGFLTRSKIIQSDDFKRLGYRFNPAEHMLTIDQQPQQLHLGVV